MSAITLRIKILYLGENVDVRDLQVDHDAEGGHGARDELAPVHHEVGVNQEYPAHPASIYTQPSYLFCIGR